MASYLRQIPNGEGGNAMPAISCIIIFASHVLLFSQVLECEADLLFHSSDRMYWLEIIQSY
jgi:hypothetical protein